MTDWTGLILDSFEIFGLIGMFAWVYRLDRRLDNAARLISIETERKAAQKAAVERLTDPESIVEDMEKGARLREMKDANRTTLPREDAQGQHARVFRPKMRSKLPSQWNPPRP